MATEVKRQLATDPGHAADVIGSPAIDSHGRVPLTMMETASTRKVNSSNVDADGLAAALRRSIAGEVRFDNGSRALYSTDSSNYRQVPIGVVIPRSVEDVIETVSVARKFGAPVLARGGGTSLAGQCCNVAVVLDMSKYLNNILDLDPVRKRARVQPGLVLDDLRNAAEQQHLTFGPDPSTHNHCTLGGMIGNNSCGVHSVMAGKTEDNIEELEILTYDGFRMRVGETSEHELARIISEGGRRGETYKALKNLMDRYADRIREVYPDMPRRISGYNLPWLLPEKGFHVARALVGSECTCVTVLEATVRLVDSPPGRTLLVLGYPDVYAAADHVPEVLTGNPIGLEGLDDVLVGDIRKKNLNAADLDLLPPGKGWLLVEFGGKDRDESDRTARQFMEKLKSGKQPPSMRLYDSREDEEKIWTVRRSGLGATARVPGKADTWEGWEDSAVPPERLGEYLRKLRSLFQKFGYSGAFYGHFGQGCVHTRIDFDLLTREGIEKYRAFIYEAAHLVVSLNGSLSGEHGDGQSRAELLPIMYGDDLIKAFQEFKAIWDPENRMNPGKVVNAYRADENLRLGIDYSPPSLHTQFKYPDDEQNFPKAILRCVGVGECRRKSGGTMCPSYRVTHEEKHSTRGRARLLFEMLQGNPLKEGWKSEAVRDALDLCLACKGCKNDCPMAVDMATYKSEFLSHYYKGRLRPRHAYALGLIYWWARIGSKVPRLVNFISQNSVLGRMFKSLGGIAPKRKIPRFAGQTFRQWFKRRTPAVRTTDRPAVILWPDTFNNYFLPEVGQAAVRVLENAGYRVEVPEKPLCCGRPLYDFGMIDLATSLLRNVIDTLRPKIQDGMPVIGLEPSCAAVFRDELVNLFPDDEDAKRLSKNTFLLSEFLENVANDYQPPRMRGNVVFHGHCHQKAVMGIESDTKLLADMGLKVTVLDSGCCGMAGSFGFEKDHYDVSVAAGELVLLPAVRQADADTLIVADGFSCREQISQTTDRRALHVAQIIDSAIQ